MDIVKCAFEAVPFYCHKGVGDGEPKRLCSGFGILIGSEAFRTMIEETT